MSRDARIQPHADPALRALFFDACRTAGAQLNAYVDALHSTTEAKSELDHAAEPADSQD